MEELVRVLFIGDDWAEDHHDVELEDEGGRGSRGSGCRRAWRASPGCTRWSPSTAGRLGRASVGAGGRAGGGGDRDRSRPVGDCAAGGVGYVVYAINPLSAARYRERHSTSGAKSRPVQPVPHATRSPPRCPDDR